MLGVLGGMGPMATVDFMAKVVRNTPAACDQDHIPMVVCSASNIPDRNAALRGEGADPLPAMRDALRRLEAAGATCIAIPCNTAHMWHRDLQYETPLPILHIVDAVTCELIEQKGDFIGVLGTTSTIEGRLYQERLSCKGLSCRVPDAVGQDAVMQAIRLVKAGQIAGAADILQVQAEALIDAGCSQVVMACTEIPVALASVEETLRTKLVDATEALARACVRVCKAVTTSELAFAA